LPTERIVQSLSTGSRQMMKIGPPTGTGDVQSPSDAPDKTTGSLRAGALALTAVAIAVVGVLALRQMTGSLGGPAQAQNPRTDDNAPQLIKDGEEITIPEGSPLRGKLLVASVENKEIQRSLVLPAVVEADPGRTVKVLPAVTGRVVDLKIELGARVAKDESVAVIESGDLAQAISDAEKARASVKLTRQALDRLMILEKSSAAAVRDRESAQNDYAQAQSELERSEERLRAIGVPPDTTERTRLLTMKSPIAGSVIDLQTAPGAFLNDPTAAIATIANLDTVWVTANVPEKDTALVVKGQSADVVFTAYPRDTFRGTVLFVSDVLDPDTRRTKVRIAFKNPDLRLKPNMFANVTFLAPKQSLPAIPNNALVLHNETDQVFVEVRPWVFEARSVEVAFQEGDQAIVAGGLTAGERIVVKDGVLLND
jgi:membrane fusion protein, heavy metal efflux system